MNDNLYVDHSSLDSIVSDLKAAVNAIENRMSELEKNLNPLQEQWIGSAKDQYQVSKQKWDQAINEMQQLLADTAIMVDSSNSEYIAADNRGAKSFEF